MFAEFLVLRVREADAVAVADHHEQRSGPSRHGVGLGLQDAGGEGGRVEGGARLGGDRLTHARGAGHRLCDGQRPLCVFIPDPVVGSGDHQAEPGTEAQCDHGQLQEQHLRP